MFQTTASYPNRILDKERLEAATGIREGGDEVTQFLTPRGAVFAVGFARVVYGDHGPYLEFERRHILLPLVRRFPGPVPAKAFYDWLQPANGEPVKVYDQKRDVKYLKNPPAGGFRGDRKEGYADYRVGLLYVAPGDLRFRGLGPGA